MYAHSGPLKVMGEVMAVGWVGGLWTGTWPRACQLACIFIIDMPASCVVTACSYCITAGMELDTIDVGCVTLI